MARKRQSRKCSGTRSTDGMPCEGYAVNGSSVCVAHGGKAPQVKAKAAGNLIEEKAARRLHHMDAEPCTDPLGALQRLAGRALQLEQVIGEIVNEMSAFRYESMAGGEQLRSEIAVLERAMDRCGKLLVDIAKLNIDERLARVTEQQTEQVAAALTAVLAELGMPQDQQRAARAGVARHLRAVS